jgi:hypothetical protein
MRLSLSAAAIALVALGACGNGGAVAGNAAAPVVAATGNVAQGGARGGVNGTAPAPAGSPQRVAILDALRPAVAQRLGADVEFVVNRLDVRDGWALVAARPQHRGGGTIDGVGIFDPDALANMDGVDVTALLRFENGRWALVEHRFGATDVWYVGYCDRAAVAC